jgi:hypothetical protein
MDTLDIKERFIELRARGYSYDRISKELGKAKQTLVDWGKDLQEVVAQRRALELEALYESYSLLKEEKIKRYGAILGKITDELQQRDFTKIPTGRLLELYLMYFERLGDEVTEPIFKSSQEIQEEERDRAILEEAIATVPNLKRLKTG